MTRLLKVIGLMLAIGLGMAVVAVVLEYLK